MGIGKEKIKEIIEMVKPGQFAITCYYETKIYKESEREEQLESYFEAMSWSDGSERNRYTNIYLSLKDGEKIIFDDEDDYYDYLEMTGQI